MGEVWRGEGEEVWRREEERGEEGGLPLLFVPGVVLSTLHILTHSTLLGVKDFFCCLFLGVVS